MRHGPSPNAPRTPVVGAAVRVTGVGAPWHVVRAKRNPGDPTPPLDCKACSVLDALPSRAEGTRVGLRCRLRLPVEPFRCRGWANATSQDATWAGQKAPCEAARTDRAVELALCNLAGRHLGGPEGAMRSSIPGSGHRVAVQAMLHGTDAADGRPGGRLWGAIGAPIRSGATPTWQVWVHLIGPRAERSQGCLAGMRGRLATCRHAKRTWRLPNKRAAIPRGRQRVLQSWVGRIRALLLSSSRAGGSAESDVDARSRESSRIACDHRKERGAARAACSTLPWSGGGICDCMDRDGIGRPLVGVRA